jgi:hypothetical protein
MNRDDVYIEVRPPARPEWEGGASPPPGLERPREIKLEVE